MGVFATGPVCILTMDRANRSPAALCQGCTHWTVWKHWCGLDDKARKLSIGAIVPTFPTRGPHHRHADPPALAHLPTHAATHGCARARVANMPVGIFA